MVFYYFTEKAARLSYEMSNQQKDINTTHHRQGFLSLSLPITHFDGLAAPYSIWMQPQKQKTPLIDGFN